MCQCRWPTQTYMFPVPGSPTPPPQMVWSPKNPPLPAATYYVRLPITCYSLLPIYYLLPITTYYYLLPTTNYHLPHTTPPHRGRGDWTMLLLLGYHDHGWGVGGDPEPGAYIYKKSFKLFFQCFYTFFRQKRRNLHVFRHKVGPKTGFCRRGLGANSFLASPPAKADIATAILTNAIEHGWCGSMTGHTVSHRGLLNFIIG